MDLTLTLQDMSALRETDNISRQTTHSNNGGRLTCD